MAKKRNRGGVGRKARERAVIAQESRRADEALAARAEQLRQASLAQEVIEMQTARAVAADPQTSRGLGVIWVPGYRLGLLGTTGFKKFRKVILNRKKRGLLLAIHGYFLFDGNGGHLRNDLSVYEGTDRRLRVERELWVSL